MKLISVRQKKLLLMIICMLAAGICYSCGGGPEEEGKVLVELEEGAEGAEGAAEGAAEVPEGTKEVSEDIRGAAEEAAEALEPSEEALGASGRDSEASLIYVHVCGMVQEPGVYGIPEGSRVYEAVEAAGGTLEEGAADFLNLAQEAEDGMKIEVPDKAQAAQWKEAGISFGGSASGKTVPGGSAAEMTKVNLNRASREELMTLKGIGESRAEDIIRYREEFGGFRTIEDIMNVPGIKEGAFDRLRDQITV